MREAEMATTVEQDGLRGGALGKRLSEGLERLGAPRATLAPPPRWPSWHPLGHLPAISRDPLRVFEEAHARFGSVVRLRAANVEIVTLADPEDWQRVLVSEKDDYSKGTRGYEKLKLVLGNGLVTSEGDFWRRQRRIAQPAFHRRSIARMAETFAAAAFDQALAWRAPASVGATVDVAEAMMQLTLRIVGLTMFSMEVSDGSGQIGRDLGVMLHEFSRVTQAPYPAPEKWPTPANFRFRGALRRLRAIVDGIIAERRASGETGEDLLGLFMATEDADTGERMNDAQLADEVMTILLAGHETTANALSWTFALLAAHPDALAEVRAEIDSVVGDALPTMATLGALPKTVAALDEAMRLYPPVWILGRRAERDVELGGYGVKRGTLVFLAPWALHRQPALWPDPERFDLRRFLPDADGNKPKLVHKLAYAPFSAGQRKCIGDHFARMEALAVLAVLLRRFELEPLSAALPAPEPTLTLRPAGGLKMKLRARAAGAAEASAALGGSPR
jgi:cytochrome P450